MAKKGKGKGKSKGGKSKSKSFFGAIGSALGSIPVVGKVKNAAKSAKKKVKKAKKKVKKNIKKAKKKLKKKIGKVYTKARKLKNNLSKSKIVKKVKRTAKKAVLATKKAVQKTKATVTKAKQQVKAAVKDTKKVMTKVAGKIAITYTSFKEGGYKETLSAIVDFIPVVGNIKAGIEVAIGRDLFTKRKLEDWERGVGFAAVFGGGLVKGAVRGGKFVSGIVTGGKNAGKSSTSVVKSLDSKKPEVKSPAKSTDKKNLLPSEGNIGTYRDLNNAGSVGDDITPHHMPSKEYLVKKLGWNPKEAKNDGMSINVEQPKTGGRHRKTETYGRNMTNEKKAHYYSLEPRDALALDLNDLRNIYKEDGLYKEMLPNLREYASQAKEDYYKKYLIKKE